MTSNDLLEMVYSLKLKFGKYNTQQAKEVMYAAVRALEKYESDFNQLKISSREEKRAPLQVASDENREYLNEAVINATKVSEDIIAEAKAQAEQITRQAQAKASEIISSAEKRASFLRETPVIMQEREPVKPAEPVWFQDEISQMRNTLEELQQRMLRYAKDTPN